MAQSIIQVEKESPSDFFVRPLNPPNIEKLYDEVRRTALMDSIKGGILSLILASVIGIPVIGLASALVGDTSWTPSVILVVGSLLALAAGTWVIFLYLTQSRWKKSCEEGVVEAKQVLQDAMRRIEASKKCRSDFTRIATECRGLVSQAEDEFKSRRFAVFWDRIEQSAAKFAGMQATTDTLNLLQTEYNSSLQGREHNLPKHLPGCTAIPADLPVINRYTQLIRSAQSDIDFAVIWEHRQTRAVMVAGFANLGDMVHNVGQSVLASLQTLIAIESAPTVAVGFIRQV